jgi:hypothetical protein
MRVAEAVMHEVAELPEQVEERLRPDGQRILGKCEIADELERYRKQWDAEMEQLTALARERRASRRRA